MDRRQAKILIGAIMGDKEIVLPSTHYHVKVLKREGMLEEVVHEIPAFTASDADKLIIRWIVTGAVTIRKIDEKMHIILYKPTNKAKDWFEELKSSRRNKDKKLLKEAGYAE